MEKKRRASLHITLILLGGSLVLEGCDDINAPVVRDVYNSLDDCRKEWGEECESTPQGSSRTTSYMGPHYSRTGSTDQDYRNNSTGPRAGSKAVSSSLISRGGFGSSISSHSSGGG